MTPAKPRRIPWGEPGSKVARKTDAIVYSRGPRQVIVTIYPNGVLGLRLAKERREESVNADDVYRRAVMERRALERAAKKAARKGKR